MAIDADRVETVTFDSFTTLVDVERSTRRVLSEYVDDPEPIVALWRYRAVDYRMVSTYVDVYETYYETTRDALEYALDVNGIDLTSAEVDEIADVFYELDVFDDVRGSMTQLVDAGYDLYIVSNGNPELLETIVSRADIGDLIEDTISAHEIQTYKPHPGIYRHAADRTDTPIQSITHVATPWYDIYGAIHAGMQGVWVNRKGVPWDTFDGEPDLIIDSLDALPASF